MYFDQFTCIPRIVISLSYHINVLWSILLMAQIVDRMKSHSPTFCLACSSCIQRKAAATHKNKESKDGKHNESSESSELMDICYRYHDVVLQFFVVSRIFAFRPASAYITIHFMHCPCLCPQIYTAPVSLAPLVSCCCQRQSAPDFGFISRHGLLLRHFGKLLYVKFTRIVGI